MRPDLLDARLKTAEAHAHQAGHKWLRDLCCKKRREALEAATEVTSTAVRGTYSGRQNAKGNSR